MIHIKSNKLNGKDLINVGIYTAIYMVIVTAIAMLGFIPVFLPLLSVLCPLIGGIAVMLFFTKVKKFGMIWIMGILMGILMLLTGMGYFPILTGIVFGLLADLLYKSGGYKSGRKAVLAHGVFSMWIWGNYIPLFITPDAYWAERASFGPEYVEAIQQLMPMWMFPVLLLSCFVFGIIGGLIGKAILKKHFIKAGIA